MLSRLVVEDVHFAYRKRRVLTGTSWSVGDGVTALLGPNGSGKTTLLKCITGLLRTNHGTVLVDDQPVAEGSTAQQLIGYVPQNPSMPGLVRVRDIVAYAAWLSEVPDDRAEALVDQSLRQMGVDDLAKRRVRTLSGGQRQRVALATGIVSQPSVLILDEPTVGLDPGQRLKARELIQQLAADRPVVLSTHMTEDVQHLADAVGVLVGGGIRYQGSVNGLVAQVLPDAASTRPGSAFERAYDDLMTSVAGS